MKKYFLFLFLAFSAVIASAQTSIDDFMGEWRLQSDGSILKITPLSDDADGTKAQYDHGTTHFYYPTYYNYPSDQNRVITWHSSNNRLNFRWRVGNLSNGFPNYTGAYYLITSFSETEMVLTPQFPTEGPVLVYEKVMLGTSEASNAIKNISIVQNPVQNEMVLKLPNEMDKVSVTIFAIDGKMVRKFIYNHGEKTNVSSLVSGIYVLAIESNGKKTNLKMIKK